MIIFLRIALLCGGIANPLMQRQFFFSVYPESHLLHHYASVINL
ncbi:hypothetical protein CEV31_4226 [Brucella thiophenivorans]|uniref:Uncharacterized protein n=1 Tax=Brucella thiophenivorans TaxID=571255 RepID=A0A256FTR9_9HYPH|nr:hypothetical protein CEV31_4226 [Brucella thiophenivorans]